MNIIILSPNANVLLTSEHFKKLHSIGNVIIETTIVPLCNVKSLYEEDEEKILAIDPDFCDWKINNIDIENIPNLKAICLETTSFNWIDIDFAKSKGIPVTNIKGFSTDAVAEWAFMMAINLSKKIPLIIRSGWKQDYEKFQGIELKGKKVAVIGLGNIGKRIAELC